MSGIGDELRTGLPAQGDRVVLVGDAAVLELGLVAPIALSLESAGFEVEWSPPVNGEPTSQVVAGLIPSDAREPFAAVVGVGGGSAVDAAKLLALSLANPDLDFTGGLAATAHPAPGPPVIAVPTTAGTGAEATAVAMLWDQHAKRMFVHARLVPRVAVLDPELLSELPPAVTASSGLDAISHAVESLLSTFRAPLTERAARDALAMLATSVPAAYSTGQIDQRLWTLLGAYQAGLALNASVVLGHSIAYTIGARTGLPHGVTCAMALPYCLAHCRVACEAQISEMAEIVCGVPDARRFLNWLMEANDTMGIPASLEDVGIDASALPDMARECIEWYPRPNHPVRIEAEGLQSLLERFLRGDVMAAWEDAAISSLQGGGP